MTQSNNSTTGKCVANDSVLAVIDIQERLGAAMPTKVLNRVVQNTSLLCRSAELLEVPVAITEQYPAGLGATNPDVLNATPDSAPVLEKTTFSAHGSDGFASWVQDSGRRSVILSGMEAHVCILQTALDLAAAGHQVYVVEDAICSRRLENYQNAIDRLRQSGISITSAESVVFEWLGDARHPHFKAIQGLLR